MSFESFNRDFKLVKRLAIGAWLASAAASVALLGLLAWAVITLVNHFA